MSELHKLFRHAEGISWAVCVGGLLALNLALVPSVRAEQALPNDACVFYTSNPSACWCEAYPLIHECQFDSQCQTLYPGFCKSAP